MTISNISKSKTLRWDNAHAVSCYCHKLFSSSSTTTGEVLLYVFGNDFMLVLFCHGSLPGLRTYSLHLLRFTNSSVKVHTSTSSVTCPPSPPISHKTIFNVHTIPYLISLSTYKTENVPYFALPFYMEPPTHILCHITLPDVTLRYRKSLMISSQRKMIYAFLGLNSHFFFLTRSSQFIWLKFDF